MSFHRRQRSLRIEGLENRSLMAGIPQLNSLPGAPNTIYLDFDGHFEPGWGNYLNVGSSGYDRDGNADLNSAEIKNINHAWSIVAEDFAPFNVNVTTVAPTAGDPRALRVVIAGQNFAQYVDHGQLKWSTGTNFVMASNGVPERGSGSAILNSFINSQPNTVYVFADTVDNFRPLTAEQIGNTASHEAGHALGLEHHQSRAYLASGGRGNMNEYEAGNGLETPIMGSNLVTDTQHVWSVGQNTAGSQDQVAILRNVLGTIADDAGGDRATAKSLTLRQSGVDPRTLDRITSAQVWGVVSSTSDADAYRFRTTQTGVVTIEALPQFEGNLDIRLEIYRVETGIRVVNGIRQSYTVNRLVAHIDPPHGKAQGFTLGLGAAWEGNLAAGDYMVVVNSHGAYGDMGNYRLTVSHRAPVVVNRAASIASSEFTAADMFFATLAAEATPPKKSRAIR